MRTPKGKSKCQFADGIDIRPDGENSLDPCVYTIKEIHKNVTVIVSQCKNCGTIDISWKAQENTESEIFEKVAE